MRAEWTGSMLRTVSVQKWIYTYSPLVSHQSSGMQDVLCVFIFYYIYMHYFIFSIILQKQCNWIWGMIWTGIRTWIGRNAEMKRCPSLVIVDLAPNMSRLSRWYTESLPFLWGLVWLRWHCMLTLSINHKQRHRRNQPHMCSCHCHANKVRRTVFKQPLMDVGRVVRS